MPYIDQNSRARLAPAINALKRLLFFATPGLMNYVITQLLIAWIGAKVTYARLNNALGILEGVKLELYRRMVAPYEDVKCEESGDVFPHE